MLAARTRIGPFSVLGENKVSSLKFEMPSALDPVASPLVLSILVKLLFGLRRDFAVRLEQ